jgi:hypothetical protein
MASYGLLGAEWLDNGQVTGTVTVGINGTGFPMKEPLVPTSEDVRVGLLGEYADAVVSGFERVVNEGWSFSGEVNFRWAAHSVAGSSQAFFSDLSVLVAQLLRRPVAPSEDDLVSMLS